MTQDGRVRPLTAPPASRSANRSLSRSAPPRTERHQHAPAPKPGGVIGKPPPGMGAAAVAWKPGGPLGRCGG